MINDFKIEKNIPLPQNVTKKKLYPFEKMLVGDSFFIKLETTKKLNSKRSTLRTLAYRQNPKKFTVRQVDGGLRCWRIK